MKKLVYVGLCTVWGLLILGSCSSGNKPAGQNASNQDSANLEEKDVIPDDFLTAEKQAALTPDEVLTALKKGNEEFVSGNLTIRNTSDRVRKAAVGQFPKAVILSCLDSRVPVEDVFHRGIGDLFVARVAGNIVNEDILGSMEFGTKVAGAKVIVVMGHEFCGAVKSAIDNVKLGNITALLAKIRPAVLSLSSYKGDKTSANAEFVHDVSIENIRLTINKIRSDSEILRDMEKNNQLKIVGALYNMETGKVDWLGPDSTKTK